MYVIIDVLYCYYVVMRDKYGTTGLKLMMINNTISVRGIDS